MRYNSRNKAADRGIRMNYNNTGMKDKAEKEVFAKSSCKKCHGTGKIGDYKTVKGNYVTTITCNCCRVQTNPIEIG